MVRIFLCSALLTMFCTPLVRAQFRVGTPGQAIQVPAKPSPPIVHEVTLENPRNSQAKSFLDLDSGKTFAYGDSTPEDYTRSRRWLRENGIDLMCETRPPTEGFASYDMVLVSAKDGFDQTSDYNAVSNQVRATQAQPFDLVAVGGFLPRTYLFRTGEGAIGVLEIMAIDPDSRQMHLRYKILEKPAPPPRTAQVVVRAARVIAFGPGGTPIQYFDRSDLVQQIELQQQSLLQLRLMYGEGNPAVAQTLARLEMLRNELARIQPRVFAPATRPAPQIKDQKFESNLTLKSQATDNFDASTANVFGPRPQRQIDQLNVSDVAAPTTRPAVSP